MSNAWHSIDILYKVAISSMSSKFDGLPPTCILFILTVFKKKNVGGSCSAAVPAPYVGGYSLLETKQYRISLKSSSFVNEMAGP